MGAFGPITATVLAAVTTSSGGGSFRIGAQPGVGESIILLGKGALDATDQAPFHLAYRNNAGTYELLWGFVDTGLAVKSVAVAYTMDIGRWEFIAWSFAGPGRTTILYAGRRWAWTRPTDLVSLTELVSTTLIGPPAAGTAGVRIASGGAKGIHAASEVFLFSAVLSQATLESRLATRMTGQEANLVALWPLDDGRDGRDLYTPTASFNAWDISGANGAAATLSERGDWTDDPHDCRYETGVFPYFVLGWMNAARLPGCTITVTDATAGYPGSNLRNALQAKPWRSLNATGNKDVLFDFGRPVPIGALVLDGLNLTFRGTVTAYYYATDPTDPPDYTVQLRRHPIRIRQIHPRPQEYRHLRVRFSDPGGVTYISVGTICPFVTWEPSRDGAQRAPLALSDMSSSMEMPHRFRVTRDLPVSESETFSFSDLRCGEAEELMRIARLVGGGQSTWACEDPGHKLYTRSPYGYVSGLPTMTIKSPGIFASVGPLTIMEDRAAA